MSAKRAVAYIRVTENEAPKDQELAIEAWAQREQVDVRSWETDIGLSGATPIAERPGLLAAYRAIAAHRAGILVAANAERFAHDELVCWLIERAALSQGAVIQTADGSGRRPVEGASTSADRSGEGWTRGAIELARAHERVVIRENIRAALAEKRARHERVGNLPYGYRLAEDGVHTEPDPAEQHVIATVRRLSADGLSQRAIAAQLGLQRVVGRTGAPLRQTQIANILRSTRA